MYTTLSILFLLWLLRFTKHWSNWTLEKPSGPDHLEPRFLKLAADLLAESLTHLFNLSLATNKIPKIWRAAYVRPLLKGGDPTIWNHYRPLSNLSVLSKVLESLVSEQFKHYVDAHQTLNVHQSGIRKNHSTTTAAMKVLNEIGALDQKITLRITLYWSI